MADLTYKEYRSKGNCTSLSVELFCPLSGKVFRLQLHKTKHSLALRNYLDSFSFSPFFRSSSLLHPHPLFLLATSTQAAQQNCGLSVLGAIHDMGEQSLSNLIWLCLPWLVCPALESLSAWTAPGFHWPGCYTRQDAVVKQSIQSHVFNLLFFRGSCCNINLFLPAHTFNGILWKAYHSEKVFFSVLFTALILYFIYSWNE